MWWCGPSIFGLCTQKSANEWILIYNSTSNTCTNLSQPSLRCCCFCHRHRHRHRHRRSISISLSRQRQWLRQRNKLRFRRKYIVRLNDLSVCACPIFIYYYLDYFSPVLTSNILHAVQRLKQTHTLLVKKKKINC